MHHTCIVPGCGTKTTSRYSRYCSRHKGRFRRHGAPTQSAITKTKLRPYLHIVRKCIERNPYSEAWTTLDARWMALCDHAQAVVQSYKQGKAGPRFERSAAYEVLKLSGDVPPRAVVETTLAMVTMWELEPRAFTSDDAFWVQLSRRVRGLTDLNFGERYVHSIGSVKRSYRELAPKASIILGRWLSEALGIGGLHIARLEREHREKHRSEREALSSALQALV